MEEFIDNFNAFKEWLYDEFENGAYDSLGNVINKFEALGLNKAF